MLDFSQIALSCPDTLCFQLIPEISSLSAVTTAVPLFSVLTLTAIKYGYDDIVSIAFNVMASRKLTRFYSSLPKKPEIYVFLNGECIQHDLT